MRGNKKAQAFFLCIIFCFGTARLSAQDERAQYPVGLKNVYFGVNIGYINYPFTTKQMEPGYSAGSVLIPHTAVRLVLYGLPLNKYLSARITYMRPILWVRYKNINGTNFSQPVWMNIAGLTAEGNIPISEKISITVEAGLGIITRHGFSVNNVTVVKNLNYATGLFGGSIQYHLSNKWDFLASMAWSPENNKDKQPYTVFFGGGFKYNLRPIPQKTIEKNSSSGFIFPKQFILAGYTTSSLGYGTNNFFANGTLPIFWGGEARVKSGISVNYYRNIFHTRKGFALDWSASLGVWKSKNNGDNFLTASINPVFRFYAMRSKPLDLFFEYSVAGPSFISKFFIDSLQTGKKFTFHDFMGMGVFAGKEKKLYAGLRIAHYSNGNIFPENAGIMIPLTFNVGYAIK